MFKTFIIFRGFFKSLLLQILWIYDFCDFMSCLGFGLYYGRMDFPHFFQLQGQVRMAGSYGYCRHALTV